MPYPPPAPQAQPDPATGVHPRDLWEIVARNRWVVIAVALSVVAAAALVTWAQDKVWESKATVRIEDEKSLGNPLAELTRAAGLGGLGEMGKGSAIQTEVLVLQSRRVAEPVVDSLGLQLQVIRPDVPRQRLFDRVISSRRAVAGRYRLRLEQGGGYRLTAEDKPGPAELPSRVRPGEPFSVGGMELRLAPSLRNDPPREIRFTVVPFPKAVDELGKALAISRVHPGAQLVSIVYRSNDSLMVAEVPNALTRSFLRYKSETNTSQAGTTVGFLREQVATYERQLAEAESALQSFRERARIVSPKDQATEFVKRMAEVEARRMDAVAERRSLAGLLEQAARQSTDRGAGPSPYRQLATYPIFFSSRSMQDILQALIQLENERAELMGRRTEAHPDVQALDQRIAELEQQIRRTTQDYVASLDSLIGSLDETLAGSQAEVGAVPAREIEFARLLRQQKILEEVYLLLQTRLKEQEIQEVSVPTDVRVVDDAIVPLKPVAPRPLVNLLLGGVLGLVLGLLGAFGREALDPKVRTRKHVEDSASGLRVLAVVPRSGMHLAGGNGNGPKKGVSSILPVSPQTLVRSLPRRPAPAESAPREAYRALRTSLTFGYGHDAPRVLVVCSTGHGDGRSVAAANLALAFAQHGSRVLLMDCDLRSGSLHEVVGAEPQPGLADVLAGNVRLCDVAQQVRTETSRSTLSFLACGEPAGSGSAELLDSPEMRRLMDDARAAYDVVIVDAPPLGRLSDAAVLGSMADAAVLIARTGVTDRGALRAAAEQLEQLQVPVAGVVLVDNGAGHRRPSQARS